MLGQGVIEESNSSWSSPVTLEQKGPKNRLCLDARKVNSRTIKDGYPLPHIECLLSRLQETYYISAIDLKDAFWQIYLKSKSREKTAITVPGRSLYQFTIIPFGLCNAAQRMSRLMDKVIPVALRENVFEYLDDLLVCSPTFEAHIDMLSQVSACLQRAELAINVDKSKFCYSQARYLGYVVGGGCIRTNDAKTQSIQEFPQPSSAKQMRRFLGMTGGYRRFIKKYDQTEEAIKALELLKTSMATAPVLVTPDFKNTIYLWSGGSFVPNR